MASPYCIKPLLTPELHVGETCITSSDSVKDLGIIFDKCFNMTDHVSSVYMASYYHFKNISSLKTFLSEEALVTAVHAFVTFCMLYCNSLLCGISARNIDRLQRNKNSAARKVIILENIVM